MSPFVSEGVSICFKQIVSMPIFAAYDLDLQYLSLSLLRTTMSNFRKTGSAARISVINLLITSFPMWRKIYLFVTKGKERSNISPEIHKSRLFYFMYFLHVICHLPKAKIMKKKILQYCQNKLRKIMKKKLSK